MSNRKMPRQKRGESKQDYGTPLALIKAVEKRFGPLVIDLAATKALAKAPTFISPEEDSFKVDWAPKVRDHNAWLNPPFAHLDPWAARCDYYQHKIGRGRIFLLTPASVGSQWFVDHVYQKAYVISLVGRLTFEGEKQPYPKDCMLSVFGQGIAGFEAWDWREVVGE